MKFLKEFAEFSSHLNMSTSINVNFGADLNDNKSQSDVEQLRAKFLSEYEDSRHLYHEKDEQRIRQSDLWVERFLCFQNQGLEKGFQHMKDVMKWRKSFGIHEFTDEEIPREAYQTGGVFIYEPDKDGILPIYIRGRCHFQIDLLQQRIKQGLIHFIEKADSIANRQFGWSLIIDCSFCSYQNADLNMLRFMTSTLRQNYPNGAKYVVIYGLPWILNAFAKLAYAFLPSDTAKKVRFYNREQLLDLIPIERIPDFMGGSCKREYRIIPPKCKSGQEIGQQEYGLSADEVTDILKHFQPYILEYEQKRQLTL